MLRRFVNPRLIRPSGKGKTYWVYYAIRRCLSERKPFFWYFQQQLFLFVGSGVFKVPKKFHEDDLALKALTWTFVDADEVERVPLQLIKKHSSFFVIFTTSPLGNAGRGWASPRALYE